MTIPIYIIRLVSISNTLKSCQVPALSRNLTTYLTNSYLQFGLGSEVGLDVEVSKEGKEVSIPNFPNFFYKPSRFLELNTLPAKIKSYLQFGLWSKVGLDVEVSKEEKEDESVAEHVVGERQGEGAIVVEDLKQKYR
jgi:hypothetical protein